MISISPIKKLRGAYGWKQVSEFSLAILAQEIEDLYAMFVSQARQPSNGPQDKAIPSSPPPPTIKGSFNRNSIFPTHKLAS